MTLADDIKDGLAFLKDVQAVAKDNQPVIEQVAGEIQKLADVFRSLSRGDAAPIAATMTQFEDVNRLLLAQASAEQELTKGAAPDWNEIGDGIATVAGIAVKVALSVAAAS